MRAAQTFVNKPTDHLRNWGFPSRHTIPLSQATSREQSECGMHGLSNILKLESTFLYSMYHQGAGKTNLFHMRGGRFQAGNTLCTFNVTPQLLAAYTVTPRYRVPPRTLKKVRYNNYFFFFIEVKLTVQ